MLRCPQMSFDILGTSCDQCRSCGGGGGGVWLSHPSLKEAARTALFGVLNQSARHLRTLSPTSSSSHYLKGECFCAVVKYSRASMMTTRVAPFNVN